MQAYELWKNGQGMEFVDLSLDDTLSSCKLMKCLQIALLCVQNNANDRPSMLDVSLMLRNDYDAIKTPQRPAFSCKNEVHQGVEAKFSRDTNSSVNDATITEVVGR